MAATITMWVSEDFDFPTASGLGFYGDEGFGAPVPLRSFQGHTFVTNPAGGVQGFEANNCKLCTTGGWSGVAGVSGVIVGQMGSGIALTRLPNYLSTFNVRLVSDSAVQIQNARIYFFDGEDVSHAPSGLDFYAAEIRHAGRLQTDIGDGDQVWTHVHGTTAPLSLVDSPGTSGLKPNGDLTTDTRHDWYVAASCAPNGPGDKQFGMLVELEYV
jgi:hypothetical protein